MDRRTQWCLPIAAALLVLIAPALYASAQNIFERMVMPGKLIRGHAKLETDCGNCHKPFSKTTQTKLCLDCHDKVAADLKAARGFHGRRQDIASTACKHCHTDHIGRDADIVQLDTDTFDHKMTDFPLKGRHAPTRCGACHKPRTKFREAPLACVSCHRQDEPHQGRLGEKCDSCHSEDRWTLLKTFNHDETDFPLKGKHRDVACKACHAGERYKDIPSTCIACHALQDVHKGERGNKCDKCHTPKKWKALQFDHDKDTDFPLRGRHRQAKCESCHKDAVFKEKLSSQCVACHRQDDAHKGQLGEACGQCHHETGWRQDVAFDHDITRFPLIGLHATVPCEECHISRKFKDTSLKCIACHRSNDFHKGRLTDRCDLCHNPNGWAFWRFDHDRQTKFPLTGAHKGLACRACHTKQASGKIELAKTCYACHQHDDVHHGSFSRRCERCHTTESFSGVRIRR